MTTVTRDWPPKVLVGLTAHVRIALEQAGYCHLATPLDALTVEELIANLGIPIGRDDVRLYVTTRKLHSPDPIEFHTDSDLVDVICWHCLVPARAGGATLLLDTAGLERALDPELYVALERVTMDCPNRTHDQRFPRPLLRLDGAKPRLFYTPWMLHPPADAVAEKALTAFQRFVDEHSHDPIAVRLEAGECLVIDNRRLLHGRGPLPPDTSRHLKRTWIATGDIQTELMT